MRDRKGCPRCEKRGLKTWDELSDDEKEVIKRLPGSSVYSDEDRKTGHRWCTRCWYEQIEPDSHHA